MKRRLLSLFAWAASFPLLAQAGPRPEAFWSYPAGTAVDVASLKTGFNVNTIHVSQWNRPENLRLFEDMSAQLLRFPGGTDATFWDWRKGWFVDRLPSSASSAIKEAQRKGPQGRAKPLESMDAAFRGTGLAPIFILNFLTSDIDDQLAMLRHARELGIPIPYVELGNEYYWGRFAARFPSGYAYAREAGTWTERIKREFPATKVGLVVQAIEEDQDSPAFARKASEWSKGVTRAWREHPAHFPDAAIIHPYTFPGGARYPELLHHSGLDDDGLRAVFASAFLSGAKVKATVAGLPAALTPWITEYSMMDVGVNFDGHTLVQTEWAQALYTATETLNLLLTPRLEILIYTGLGGAPNFTAVYQSDYASAYLKRYGRTPPAPYALTGPGLVLKCIAAARQGMDRARVVALPNVVRVSANVGAAVTFPGAIAVTFENGRSCRTILVNLTPRSLKVPRTALAPASRGAFRDQKVESYCAAPLHPVVDLATDVTSASGRLDTSLELPAYSFNYVH